MELTSSAFEHNGLIPAHYTCDGENISPPLAISGVPDNAESLVLIVEDPDVPHFIKADGMWDHWVLWNIPPETSSIEEGSNPGGVEGVNTGGRNGYGGPCPPDKEHRYFFKLYALDIVLDLPQEAEKNDVVALMDGHIIDYAELIGRYERV